jgi:hypothetical protein
VKTALSLATLPSSVSPSTFTCHTRQPCTAPCTTCHHHVTHCQLRHSNCSYSYCASIHSHCHRCITGETHEHAHLIWDPTLINDYTSHQKNLDASPKASHHTCHLAPKPCATFSTISYLQDVNPHTLALSSWSVPTKDETKRVRPTVGRNLVHYLEKGSTPQPTYPR